MPYFFTVFPSLLLLCSYARAHSKCCSTCQSIYCQHFSFSTKFRPFSHQPEFRFVCFTLVRRAFCCSLSGRLCCSRICVRPIVWLCAAMLLCALFESRIRSFSFFHTFYRVNIESSIESDHGFIRAKSGVTHIPSHKTSQICVCFRMQRS